MADLNSTLATGLQKIAAAANDLANAIAALSAPIPAPVMPTPTPAPPAPVSSPVVTEPASYTTAMGDVIPNFAAAPTVVAPWSVQPSPTDRVVIPAGVSVALSQDLHVDSLTIHGTLSFAKPCKLQAANILVAPDGTLALENADDSQIVFSDKPLDFASDPSLFGTGLINLGKVNICGTRAPTPFIRLSKEPAAGDTTLLLSSAASQWNPGDSLVLPDSRHLNLNERGSNYVSHAERTMVAAVSADGLTISLTAPLKFSHPASRNPDGTLFRMPHVAHLTRDVVIRSENPAGTRGHFLSTDKATLELCNVRFEDLGRTTIDDLADKATSATSNVKGRYAGPHLHHLMTAGNSVANCVVDFTTPSRVKWGLVAHNAHYNTFKGNVIHGLSGAGIVCEDGSETENAVDGNIVLCTSGDGRMNDENGTAGSAYWFRGPNNRIRNNIAATSTGGNVYVYGFNVYIYDPPLWLRKVKIPVSPGMPSSRQVDLHAIPLLEFSGNEVYGATPNGFSLWWVGSHGMEKAGSAGTMAACTVWHNHIWGVFLYETSGLTIDALAMRGDLGIAPENRAAGLWASDYVQHDLLISSPDIANYRQCIIAPFQADSVTIHNGTLTGVECIVLNTPQTVGPASWVGPRNVTVNGTVCKSTDGLPLRAIVMSCHIPPGGGNYHQNYIVLDQVFIKNFQGVQGDSFQLFYNEQAPNAVIPKTGDGQCVGCNDAGLTNSQAWAKYGLAIGGAVAPANAVARAGIVGLVA